MRRQSRLRRACGHTARSPDSQVTPWPHGGSGRTDRAEEAAMTLSEAPVRPASLRRRLPRNRGHLSRDPRRSSRRRLWQTSTVSRSSSSPPLPGTTQRQPAKAHKARPRCRPTLVYRVANATIPRIAHRRRTRLRRSNPGNSRRCLRPSHLPPLAPHRCDVDAGVCLLGA